MAQSQIRRPAPAPSDTHATSANSGDVSSAAFAHDHDEVDSRASTPADEVEELFARFEHYVTLAQFALDDLQSYLARLRREHEADIGDHGEQSEEPDNVLSFRSR